MKENVITNIVTTLIDKIGIDNTNIVKDTLLYELKDYKIEKESYQVVIYEDEITGVVKKFIAIKKLQGCTNRTLKAYFDEIEKFFKVIHKNVKDITIDDVRIYLAICRKTASNTTLDNKRRYLNSFFEWCAEEEIISKNPIRKMEKIKSPKKVKESFTDIEIEQMRNELYFRKQRTVLNQKGNEEVAKLRNIAIFEVLLSTGVRVSELVGMNINQLDFENGEIIVLGKGQKERTVYLNAKAKTSLQNYLKIRNDNLEALFIAYDPFTGEPFRMQMSGVEQMVRKLGKKFDIESHPHKFRRTAATTAAKKGMPIEQIQKLLGHESIGTTQIYVNVQSEQVKNSHEKYFN